VTLTFDLESGVRVTCDVGYLCVNFSLPKPLSSRLRPDVRDRQTSDSIIVICPRLLRAGHNNTPHTYAAYKKLIDTTVDDIQHSSTGMFAK